MLIMSFMNSEKEALDLPAIVTGNGEAYPKQWLAVYVRLYHEKKTSARLNTLWELKIFFRYKKKFINGVTAGKKYPGY